MAASCEHQAQGQGVRNTPSSVEAEAAQTAAGTLPRAMETKAMADCTVAGRAQR